MSITGNPVHSKGEARGVIKVRPEMLQAHAMRAAGKSLTAVAKFFGRSTHSISKWCTLVEEAMADQRNRMASAAPVDVRPTPVGERGFAGRMVRNCPKHGACKPLR